jgi:Uma2 family endonuclease
VLTGIRWDTYEALLTDLGDRPIHLTFDRGRLEIMTPSSEHERYRKFLGRLIETMTLELRIAIASAGSTTIKRRDLQRP